MDGQKRPDRALPPTYHISRTQAVFGLTAYCIGFEDGAPFNLLIRSVRLVARGYAVPLAVLLAEDGQSITVYLHQEDERLALLRWLSRKFKPRQHHAKIVPRTAKSISIHFVDGDYSDDLLVFASAALGLDGVENAWIEGKYCNIRLYNRDGLDALYEQLRANKEFRDLVVWVE